MTPKRNPTKPREWRVWVVTHNGRPAMHGEPNAFGMFARNPKHLFAFLSEEVERATLVIDPPRKVDTIATRNKP